MARELSELLDRSLRVLVFSGEHDIVCHYMGSDKALAALTWNGTAAFNKQPQLSWFADSKKAGKIKQYKNLVSLLGEISLRFLSLYLSVLPLSPSLS